MAAFGSYEVLQTVAVGSTGTVYQARHVDIGRVAAIKELNAAMRAVPGLLERFRGEAQALAALDDEHVVAVFDFVEEPGRVWIAEEWVDGVTIATLLSAAGRLSPEQSLGVLRGALLGLAHAHDRGLVHRDFSQANILTDQAGTSKLVDFGLAAPVGGTGRCGTPAYMSPEAARGEPLDKPSDVYSAAAVLYSLLAGRMPFPARTVQEVLHAQIEQPPPALAGHGPAMGELLAHAMAKDPTARPPDARAFLQRLEDAAGERYGPDWLQRASIAGLVAALGSGAATLATGAGTAAGSAGGATAPAVFTDAATSTGTAPGTAAMPVTGTPAGVGTTAGIGAVAASGTAAASGAEAAMGRRVRGPNSGAEAAMGRRVRRPGNRWLIGGAAAAVTGVIVAATIAFASTSEHAKKPAAAQQPAVPTAGAATPSPTLTRSPAPSTAATSPKVSLAALPAPDSSCRREAGLKSINGNTPVSIRFVNRTRQTLRTIWLDYTGKRVDYQRVPPGGSYSQATWITHPWIVADSGGTCLTLFVTDGVHSTVTVG